MSTNGAANEDLDSLPPSARYVLQELKRNGGQATRQHLVNELCHRERTISMALKTLENRGYLTRERKNDDLRQVVARLADE